MGEGRFTIPTYIFLTQAHRAKLERLLHERELDLAALLTEIVTSYLDQLPDPVAASAAPQSDELPRRRAELQRLRARVAAAGSSAPEWLRGLVADLEAEIARLEGTR